MSSGPPAEPKRTLVYRQVQWIWPLRAQSASAQRRWTVRYPWRTGRTERWKLPRDRVLLEALIPSYARRLRKHFLYARGLEFRAVFHGFRYATQGFLNRLDIQPVFSQGHRGLGTIQGFGHSRRLCEIQLPHGLNKSHYLAAKLFFDARQLGANYFHFFFKAGKVDPVIEAASFQRVTQFASAIGSENDIGDMLGLDCAHLGNSNLKIGQ